MLLRAGRVAVAVLGGLVALSGGVGCAQRSDLDLGRASSGAGDRTTTTTSAATTTTEPPTTAGAETTTTPPATSAPPTTAPATPPALVPGSPCTLGSHPDCIDPDGDGVGTYLLLGAECIATFPDAPELCSDLDEDGVAGYPDAG